MEFAQYPDQPADVYGRLSSDFRAEVDLLQTEDERHLALKAIETMNTPLYAAIAEFETGSEDVARAIHTRVRDEGVYVLFLDRAFEQRDEPSRLQAEEQHQKVLQGIPPKQQEQLLALEQKLFTFWAMEQDLRERMRTGTPVPKEELRAFILRKSTDVFLYATVTRFTVPIPREVMLELYMHQLLRDVEDDFRDLGEDAQEQMPNPLLLRAWMQGGYDVGQSYGQQQLESLVTETGVLAEHSAFVQQYCRTIAGRLPDKYRWMRKCAGTAINF